MWKQKKGGGGLLDEALLDAGHVELDPEDLEDARRLEVKALDHHVILKGQIQCKDDGSLCGCVRPVDNTKGSTKREQEKKKVGRPT